jgi:hypothetical protein
VICILQSGICIRDAWELPVRDAIAEQVFNLTLATE